VITISAVALWQAGKFRRDRELGSDTRYSKGVMRDVL